MKKAKFLSGFNAKMALAAVAVAGFTLTGCEKEDFSVNVPAIDVTVPEIQWPEAQNGIVYVMFSASGTDGNLLTDVKFTANGTVGESYTVKGGNGDVVLTVSAEKSGYYTVTKEITIAEPLKNTMAVLPVNFVLNTVDPEATVVTPLGEPVKQEETSKTEISVSTPVGGFQPNNVYHVSLLIPTGNDYMTSAQKEAFYLAIDALTGSETRAEGDADLAYAKDVLRGKVASFSSKSETTTKEVDFMVTEPAKSVSFTINSDIYVSAIKLSTVVNGKTYSVTGECTYLNYTGYSQTVDGVEIGHDHGHGHGDNDNAGGSMGGR